MRLLTRSDFDGLVSAVLLKEIGVMERWEFVHPTDLQNGRIQVTKNDVLVNVPFVPGCGLWFDHHSSEMERLNFNFPFEGASRLAPSCARVIWDYYGGQESFPEHFPEMLRFVDKCDSANLTAEEIEHPTGWVLLSFIMDPRTGLGRYRDYRISNYQLMEKMIEWCGNMHAEAILEQPDVKERVERYFEQDVLFRKMLRERSTVRGNVVVLDLRDQPEIYSGNRFVLYTMFPECNISIRVIWGREKGKVVFTCGHSIVNRTSKTDVGSLMLRYGGGGHKKVGSCQAPQEQADARLEKLVEHMNDDG
jgi:nanoRNase/pAp phosphatase (c-di-AMP/oligoRNAs hydrolase)